MGTGAVCSSSFLQEKVASEVHAATVTGATAIRRAYHALCYLRRNRTRRAFGYHGVCDRRRNRMRRTFGASFV